MKHDQSCMLRMKQKPTIRDRIIDWIMFFIMLPVISIIKLLQLLGILKDDEFKNKPKGKNKRKYKTWFS